MKRLTDFRDILRYVPRFRDRTFVIAIDGDVVADDNFSNLLLDIALLRSLRIGVAIVHGAGAQIRRLASERGVPVSNTDGIGVTDRPTLDLSIAAATGVTQTIIVGMSQHDLRATAGNVLVAHPAGILGGVDHQLTGRVERVDSAFLRTLMDHDIVPIIAPIASDGEGNTFRLNSDAVAVEVAKALQAVKLIYLGAHPPLQRGERLLRHMTADEATHLLKKGRELLSPPEGISKMEAAARAVKAGVPRVHIIDGREEQGLLAEVFSNEGIGTLIDADEYQSIRMAQKKDVRAMYELLNRGMASDELRKRTKAEVERALETYYVFEFDKKPVACGALYLYPSANRAELGSVYVSAEFENRGIGARMIKFAEDRARQAGYAEIFCLSTQAINYFIQKAGFRLGTPDDLPADRREVYEKSGRKSQVLLKKLI